MSKPAPTAAQIAASESLIQKTVARYLDSIGVHWCHTPNGGLRNINVARTLKGQGVKPGVPDILIFDPPPASRSVHVGAALELKAYGGRVSDSQKFWLEQLAERNWRTAVCTGIDEAMNTLREMGYTGPLAWS